MAGDHGVTAEGVSAFPQEVTVQMIHNFVNGGAGVNVLARQAGARVVVVDVGVAGDLTGLTASGAILSRRIGPGTNNISRGPAMTTTQAHQAIEVGIQLVDDLAGQTDLFATGEMGIGNTTASSAVVAALCNVDPQLTTGQGTGIDEERLRAKMRIVQRALEVNQPDPGDPVDVLAKVGGFEIGAIAGLVLCAALRRKPIIIDGFIASAGATLAHALCPIVADYIIAAHRSPEPGHGVALEQLGKMPLLDLGMRLGEGTGAVLAMHLVKASVCILTEMATFDGAGISGSTL
jgi:nicotinate-nucleotide--dimethylbenzimidazole phosphoribosyltransferase